MATTRDPDLSQTAQEQCTTQRLGLTAVPSHTPNWHFVSSPLLRALRTACKVFDDPVERSGRKIIVLPELQETSIHPYDTCSDPLTLSILLGDKMDFSQMSGKDPSWFPPPGNHVEPPIWLNKTTVGSPYNADISSLLKRATAVREWLGQLARGWTNAGQAHHVFVFSHVHFLGYLTENHGYLGGHDWAPFERRVFLMGLGADGQLHLKRHVQEPAPRNQSPERCTPDASASSLIRPT